MAPLTAYSWIACQLEVGTQIIFFAVEVKFQIQDQFWISQPKLHGRMYSWIADQRDVHE